jgi:ubiquinol-cytochrome c reductase cytochrome b subunit
MILRMWERIRQAMGKAASNADRPGAASGKQSPGGWFDRHFLWRRFLREQVLGRETFAYRSAWDYLGSTGTIALALIAVQFTSGFFLLLYYIPEPDQAFDSLQTIRNDVPFGMFYSNLHSIGAKLLILTVFIHLFRVMIVSAHRGPREPQWYGGVLLLALMLLAGFSGYLLPWSQQSYWAAVIGTEAVRAIPLIGHALFVLLRGGEDMTGVTLHRFFALHVTLLPMGLLILIWMHLKRAWKTGVIAPPDMHATVIAADCTGCGKCERACSFNAVTMIGGEERQLPRIDRDACNACRACVQVCPADCIAFASDRRAFLSEPIFPDHVIKRLQAAMVGLTILFFSVFFLHGLMMGAKIPADPMLTPERIKPDWYFLAAYQVLRGLPNKRLGLSILLAVSLLLFFLPAIDRSGPRDFRRRPVYLFLVLAGILAFVVLTVVGYF